MPYPITRGWCNTEKASASSTRAYSPARNIFAGLREWAKTLSDFDSGILRLAGISAVCPYGVRQFCHFGALVTLFTHQKPEEPDPVGVNKMGTTARIGNVAGSSAAVAAGLMDVMFAIKEGGGRGAAGWIGSALGVAALLRGLEQSMMVSAAAIAGVIKGLIPSAKVTVEKD